MSVQSTDSAQQPRATPLAVVGSQTSPDEIIFGRAIESVGSVYLCLCLSLFLCPSSLSSFPFSGAGPPCLFVLARVRSGWLLALAGVLVRSVVVLPVSPAAPADRWRPDCTRGPLLLSFLSVLSYVP